MYLSSFRDVYLVRHKETKAEYIIRAIKKIDRKDEEIPHLRKDVEAMYKIHHQNVLKLFGHFEDNRYCYLIMEYNSKMVLYDILPKDKTKRLSTKVCSSIIRDVISAVYYLHHMEPPIIHENIRPENVLIGNELLAKLANFTVGYYFVDEGRRALHAVSQYLTYQSSWPMAMPSSMAMVLNSAA